MNIVVRLESITAGAPKERSPFESKMGVGGGCLKRIFKKKKKITVIVQNASGWDEACQMEVPLVHTHGGQFEQKRVKKLTFFWESIRSPCESNSQYFHPLLTVSHIKLATVLTSLRNKGK